MLCINAMLFLGQIAVIEINAEATVFTNCPGSLYGSYEANNCTNISRFMLANTNPAGRLPSAESSISVETGNIFTDSFTGLRNWISTVGAGLSILGDLLSAPYVFLTALHLPAAFVGVVGTLWYAFSLFLVVAWLFGRST